MGGLFAKLRAGYISTIVIDLESPVVKDELSTGAQEAYTAIEKCCAACDKALIELQQYTDLKKIMSIVMDGKRVDEHRQALIQALPTISNIQSFYNVALMLSSEVPRLLNFIKSENLKDQEALCKIFTRLLDKTRRVR